MKKIKEICGWGTCACAAVGMLSLVLGGYCGAWFAPATVTILCRIAAVSMSSAVLLWGTYKYLTDEGNREFTYGAVFVLIGGLIIGASALVMKITTPISYEMWGMLLYPSVGVATLGLASFGGYFAFLAAKSSDMGFWYTLQVSGVGIMFLSLALGSMGQFQIIPLPQVVVQGCAVAVIGAMAVAFLAVLMQSKWVNGKQVL